MKRKKEEGRYAVLILKEVIVDDAVGDVSFTRHKRLDCALQRISRDVEDPWLSSAAIALFDAHNGIMENVTGNAQRFFDTCLDNLGLEKKMDGRIMMESN